MTNLTVNVTEEHLDRAIKERAKYVGRYYPVTCKCLMALACTDALKEQKKTARFGYTGFSVHNDDDDDSRESDYDFVATIEDEGFCKTLVGMFDDRKFDELKQLLPAKIEFVIEKCM